MRAKKKHATIAKEEKKKQISLRRSSRLKTLSVERRTKTKIPQAKEIKGKIKKGLQHASESVIKREKGYPAPVVPKETKQMKKVSKAKESKNDKAETTSKQLASTRRKGVTTKERVPVRKTSKNLKRKLKTLNVENSACPIFFPKEKGKPQLIKKIKIEQNYYDDVSITRYSDVAFLDDNHILALDDNYLKRSQGQRICCISLDGILVCDLSVPGYPWSVVILSPTEAVLSMRKLGSNGLLWISIDIHNKSMEITRNIPFEEEPMGLAYSDRSETFIVSYSGLSYMSILNREGQELRKIPCKPGKHYRCLILDDSTILFLDYHKHTVSIMNQEGKVLSSLNQRLFREPNSLECDCFGNIYVGNFRDGNLFKFDKRGRHLWTFEGPILLCAIGLDRTSNRMAIATYNSLQTFKCDSFVIHRSFYFIKTADDSKCT